MGSAGRAAETGRPAESQITHLVSAGDLDLADPGRPSGPPPGGKAQEKKEEETAEKSSDESDIQSVAGR